jgi:hypothetical protein
MREADNTVEYRTSSADAEKALRDLMSDARNEMHAEVDMAEAIVPGFREGIVLLPHQVVGRKWMAERESGKRTGGILADDMGYAFHSSLSKSYVEFIPVWARRYRPLLV